MLAFMAHEAMLGHPQNSPVVFKDRWLMVEMVLSWGGQGAELIITWREELTSKG
jgi:hypothetical protein